MALTLINLLLKLKKIKKIVKIQATSATGIRKFLKSPRLQTCNLKEWESSLNTVLIMLEFVLNFAIYPWERVHNTILFDYDYTNCIQVAYTYRAPKFSSL